MASVPQNDRVPPIKVLRVITRLNIGGPAIHAILKTHALNDGALFQSTLATGPTAPHEGDMLDLARARAGGPSIVPAVVPDDSPLDDPDLQAPPVKPSRDRWPDPRH